ncbi:MAG: hypothetical protein IJ749_07900 [Eubacterium sp.]|nr:hypothetical protein [Eubacterium sp.]
MDNNDFYNQNGQQQGQQQTYDYSQQQQQQTYDYSQQQAYDYSQPQQQTQFDAQYAPQEYAGDQYNQYNQQAYPNQYGQQSYPNNPQGYPVDPQFDKKYISPEDNRTANILCVISLLCHFVVPFVVSFILGALTDVFSGTSYKSSDSVFTSMLSLLVSVSYLASWVLMIIVRVKYKNNTFGKVIMWIYIILLALGIIAVIILIVTCVNILRECNF